MSPAHRALRRWLARRDLSRAETEDLFGQLMDGELSEAMKSAMLVALGAGLVYACRKQTDIASTP